MFLRFSLFDRLRSKLFRKELDERRGLAGFFVAVTRLVYLSYRQFIKDLCWERAATLAFTTVLSLLPLAVLFLSFLSVFMTPGEKNAFVNKTLLPFVLPYLETATETRPGSEAGAETGSGTAASDPAVADDRLFAMAQEWLQQISDEAFASTAITQLIAISSLVIAALALLVSAERVFNLIWKVRSTRSYFQKFVAFWMILTTSPFLVALSIYIDSPKYLGEHQFITPILVSCFAFTVLYLFLPHTRVRIVPALLGGCFCGLLWEALKSGFFLYVNRAKTVTDFYGSLGVIPIFLVFVYLTWLIVLWGGELSYAMQHYRGLIRDFRLHQQRENLQSYSPVYLGVHVIEEIVKAFGTGAVVPTLEEISTQIDTGAEELGPVVQRLVADGVLVESSGGETGRYFPANSPESMDLRSVVEKILPMAGREELSFGAGAEDEIAADGPGRLLFLARNAYLDAFSGQTLADLCGGKSAPAES